MRCLSKEFEFLTTLKFLCFVDGCSSGSVAVTMKTPLRMCSRSEVRSVIYFFTANGMHAVKTRAELMSVYGLDVMSIQVKWYGSGGRNSY